MIEGIDISSHNHPIVAGRPAPIDFGALYAAGVRVVWAKLSQGDYYVNPFYAQDVADARAAGLLVGSYHFWDHNTKGAKQAAFFLAHLDFRPDLGDLLPMVDVEGAQDGGGTPTPASLPVQLQAFLDAVESALKVKPGIYTYPGAWVGECGNPRQFGQYPLWLADYTPPLGPLVGGWDHATVWQYTPNGTLPGIKGVEDRDRVVGSLDELRPVPQPPAQSDPYAQYFTQTSRSIGHGIGKYWQENGGLDQFGYPLTDEQTGTTAPFSALPELAGYTCQLFEHDLLLYSPPTGVIRGRVGGLVQELAK